MIHYLIAQSRGCELASISGPDEQFQALSTAALGWQLFAENTTRNIQAAWIGGKRISADGGGRTTNGTVMSLRGVGRTEVHGDGLIGKKCVTRLHSTTFEIFVDEAANVKL